MALEPEINPEEDKSQKRNELWPTREEMHALPPFRGLDFRHIVLVDKPSVARQAYKDLVVEKAVGFDTESRPTFRKGEVSHGPHVVQFATPERAWVFMLHDHESREKAAELIASEDLLKLGFGLGDDLSRIRIKLGVEPGNVMDLETLFAEKGYGRGVGAKVGIALLFKRQFMKSKKAGTSNWSRQRLSDLQLLYAANDAYAAIRSYRALMSA